MKKELQLLKNHGNTRNKIDYIIGLIFLLQDKNIDVYKQVACK